MKKNFCLPISLWALLSFSGFTTLSVNAQEANPVVVTGSRIAQPLAEVLPAVSVITKQDIEKVNANDMAELLQGQVGLELTRSGGIGSPTSIYLRGGTSSQTLVLVDGIPFNSEAAIGGSSPIEIIPIQQVEKIEILRGNASAIYGPGAVGGVIQIFTRQDQVDGFRPSASLSAGAFGTRSAHGTISIGHDGSQINLSAGKQRSRGIEAIPSAVYPLVNPAVNGFQSENARVSWSTRLVNGHVIGARYLYTKSDSSFDNNTNWGSTPSDNWSNRTKSNLYQVYTKNQWTPDWHSDLSLSGAETEQLTLTNDALNLAWGSSRSSHQQLSWKNTVALSSSHVMTGGYELNNSRLNGDKLSGMMSDIPAPVDKSAQRKRFFIGLNAVTGAITTQANVSHEMLAGGLTGNTYLLGVGHQIDSRYKVTATRSSAIQAPTIGQLYDVAFGGNPSLSPERSRSTEVGLQFSQANTYWRLVAFKVDYNDLIASSVSPSTDPFWAGQGVTQLVNVQSASNTGLEGQYRGALGRWGYNLGYTHQTVQFEQTEARVQNKARNFGSADVSYRWSDRLETGLRAYGTTSRLNRNPDWNYVVNPGYTLFKLYAIYKMNSEWRATTTVDNLLNREYEHLAGYKTPSRSLFLTLNYQPR